MSNFSPELKSRIFVERTSDLWPGNWDSYLQLIAHEKWSKDQLDEYNFNQRKSILKFAYENSKFYKMLYDQAGLKPQDIKTEADWAAVPIVTKQMISDYSRDIEVKKYIDDFGFAAHTGGSTGKPLRVFRDKRHFWQAPWWRFFGWHLGRRVGDPEFDIPIWGLDEASIDRSYYKSTKEWIRQREVSFWPKKFINLSPYAEFEESVDIFINELRQSPAAQMYAYAGGLDMFANYCLENDVTFSSILFIDSCASPLTEVIRNKANKVFGCNVFDFYGSNEMGPMAIECHASGPDHHLHVLSDLVHIELVDDYRQNVETGKTGTTIVTSFTNRVFPLVKYDHGDQTKYLNEPCDCGLPFPCIAPVRGRATEFLITKSGLKIDGLGFNVVFDIYPEAVSAFQFRQIKNGSVTLVVVPNKKYPFSIQEISEVLNKLNEDFSGKILFNLETVDAIKYDAGKIRYIVHE